MTEATNTKLMDIEPGGEQTQYEGSNIFNQPRPKAEGQMKDTTTTTEASQQASAEKQGQGQKTGASIEPGFGGETTGSSGSAQDGGYGRVEENERVTGGNNQTRRQMGYGDGSDVGA